MSKNTGGPAFPVIPPLSGGVSAPGYPFPGEGMTLRDYFAVHAPIPLNDHRDWQQEAEIRYMYADAMLAEREKE